MGSREEEYLRRMKALGYVPSLAGMDDEDIEYELAKMEQRRMEPPTPQLNRPYRPVDPSLQARTLRQMGQPYDKNAIPKEEEFYIGGWDNGNDDEETLLVKSEPSLFPPSRGGTRRPEEPYNPWKLNWGDGGIGFGVQPSGSTPGNGQWGETSSRGPASYRQDGLRMAAAQQDAPAPRQSIQDWYDANVWTSPEVLAAQTPVEREAAINRIVTGKAGEGLMRNYYYMHGNENDAETAKNNDVKYIVNSLGGVPDEAGINGTDRSEGYNKDKIGTTVDKAINITGSFEGHSGYENVAGNSDGAGLSLGKFQWNIAMETLQPKLKQFIEENPEKARQIFGANLESLAGMLNSSDKNEQMIWARSINNGGELLPQWKEQFTNLCKTEEFQEIQRNGMKEELDRAHKIAEEFNLKSERGFALALDIAVQNGSIIDGASIKQRIAQGASEKEVLRLLAHAAADQSDPDYKEDVRKRKLAIVEGWGRVHGKDYDLEQEFGLTDVPYR